MNTVFATLLKLSITASYIAVAAVLFRLIFKKAPKQIRMVLWGLVVLRLVLPFSFESSVSVLPANETHTPAVVDKALNEFTAPADYTEPVTYTETEPEAAAFAKDDTIQKISTEYKPSFTDIAAVVWFVGFVGMLVYAAVSYFVLYRRVDESILLDRRIYSCDKITSPFILGIFRPRIYLPSGLADIDRQNVLLHENMHIKHGDHLIKPFAYLLLAVYWFNPVMWLSYILLCRDIELICDERVIRAVGADIKKSYSESLLNLSVKRAGIAICPLAFGEVSTKQRVKNVLGYKKSAVIVTICAAVICIAVGICLLTVPKKADTALSGDVKPSDGDKYTAEMLTDTAFVYAVNMEIISNRRMDLRSALYSIDENSILKVGCPNGTFEIGEMNAISPEQVYQTLMSYDAPQDYEGAVCARAHITGERESYTMYVLMQYEDGRAFFLCGHGIKGAVDSDMNVQYAAYLVPTTLKPKSNKLTFLSDASFDDRMEFLRSNNVKIQPYNTDWISYTDIDMTEGSIFDDYIRNALAEYIYFPSAEVVSYLTFTQIKRAEYAYYGFTYAQDETYEKYAAADLYHNGTMLETGVMYISDSTYQYEFIVSDNGEPVAVYPISDGHYAWDTLYLCRMDGKDYLMRYKPTIYQGEANFMFTLFYLDADGNMTTDGIDPSLVNQSSGEFNYIDFCASSDKQGDFPQVCSFMEKVDEVLKSSRLLFTTDDYIKEGRQNTWRETVGGDE